MAPLTLEPTIVSATNSFMVMRCCAMVSTSCASSLSTPAAWELNVKMSTDAGNPRALERSAGEIAPSLSPFECSWSVVMGEITPPLLVGSAPFSPTLAAAYDSPEP